MTPERWQQIEKLCYEALELDSERRGAFIHQACANDEELRREVESMLAAHDRAGDFLQQNAFEIEAEVLVKEKALEKTRPLPMESFGHYRILSRIGAGGMGEVWLARDTKLDRNVALKFLPVQFTSDKDRLQRFTREAKAASALNHPNIITIHEIGEAETEEGKTHFIATEFIEGQTLRQVLANEELSLKKSLDIAAQAAGALDAAHHAGIIHRDIKPENIMVRPDGLVKVLDFGLAKLDARRSLPEDSVDTSAQTQAAAVKTLPGMILGTLRYMSPEQARGHEVDARTDIFSLGVVLYELIARQPLFAGETTADVIAAIINKEPELLSEFAPDTPEELERIVHKTLAKDARDRYQTARDLQIDLQNLKQGIEFQSQLSRSGQMAGRAFADTSENRTFTYKRLIAILAITMIVSGIALWTYSRIQNAKPPALSFRRMNELFNINVGGGAGLSPVTFSPDGNLVAWSLNSDEDKGLWVKQLVGGSARKIAGGKATDRNPIWSPDGQQLAFISNRGDGLAIWAVPYLDGIPTELVKSDLTSQSLLIGWFGASGTQRIYFENTPNLYSVDLATGTTKQITQFDQRVSAAGNFSISPDESMIAYADKSDTDGNRHLFVMPMHGGKTRQLTFGNGTDKHPRWFTDGKRLAFLSNQSGIFQILQVGVDGGEPEAMTANDSDYNYIALSPVADRVIAVSGKEKANIYACDVSSGQEVEQASGFKLQLSPMLSGDNKWLVFQALTAFVRMDESIFLKLFKPIAESNNESESSSKSPEQVYFTTAGFDPRWSPLDNSFVFLRNENGSANLWKASLSNRQVNQIKQLTTSGVAFSRVSSLPFYRATNNYDWSPDGTSIAYCSDKGGANIRVVSIIADNETSAPKELAITQNNASNVRMSSPMWAPDSQRLAFLVETTAPQSVSQVSSRLRRVELFESGKTIALFETAQPIRLIGWEASGKELLIAISEAQQAALPQSAQLLAIGVDIRTVKTIATLPAMYLFSLVISPDRRSLAWVSRQNDKDNVHLISVSGGAIKQITRNNESATYLSGLTWGADGKTVLFSKQTSWAWIWMIEPHG